MLEKVSQWLIGMFDVDVIDFIMQIALCEWPRSKPLEIGRLNRIKLIHVCKTLITINESRTPGPPSPIMIGIDKPTFMPLLGVYLFDKYLRIRINTIASYTIRQHSDWLLAMNHDED